MINKRRLVKDVHDINTTCTGIHDMNNEHDLYSGTRYTHVHYMPHMKGGVYLFVDFAMFINPITE